MNFTGITTSIINKTIYTVGEAKKEGQSLENAIKRTVENKDGKTIITYEIPQFICRTVSIYLKCYIKPTIVTLEVKPSSPKEKNIEFKLPVQTCLSEALLLSYNLKENDKKELLSTEVEVWESSRVFSCPRSLSSTKSTFLPLIEKALNREPNPDYKRYLQTIYDGVKLAK